MSKFFNTKGPCLTDTHYMIDPIKRLTHLPQLIERSSYFIIQAPPQTGKTTLLRNISKKINKEGKYAAVTFSLKNIKAESFETSISKIMHHIGEKAKQQLSKESWPPDESQFKTAPDIGLNHYLSNWSESSALPIVLFMDEIDCLEDEILISVLRQLRDGYNSRPAPFPSSVALVGIKDVSKARFQTKEKTESWRTDVPFNIVQESILLRNFTKEEVKALLDQHTKETGQQFEKEAVEDIFKLTAGHPWLVNALAAELTTNPDALVPDRAKPVKIENVLEAKDILIERRDTHLDSLVDKLKEERVKKVIEQIMIGGISLDATYEDDFTYTRDLGLVTIEQGFRKISNPIYQEIIPRVLTH